MEFTTKKIINIPEYAQFVLQTLNSNGFEAYVVGGCVRDSLLEQIPLDWDITTCAEPSQIKKLFPKSFDTGIAHGTITVVIGNQNIEITTFRTDGTYTDGRHPDRVIFTSSLYQDLSRRDFTMNAIAYNPNAELIDPFNGFKDICDKKIRAVGDPLLRFNEDALRMLRAIRFSSQLGFDIEEKTLKAIYSLNMLIKSLSSERISSELTKLLTSKYPEKFDVLYESGLLKHIIPEFELCYATDQQNPHHIYDVAHHSIKAVMNVDNTAILRWAMLLHDIGKPITKTVDEKGVGHFYNHQHEGFLIAKNILTKLKFDNTSKNKILSLVKHHDRQFEPNPTAVKRAIQKVGEDVFIYLLEVKRADALAQNPAFIAERLQYIESIRQIYDVIKNKKEPMCLKDLAINGSDLINEGFPTGRQIGIILKALLERVIENPELNKKEVLMNLAHCMHEY